MVLIKKLTNILGGRKNDDAFSGYWLLFALFLALIVFVRIFSFDFVNWDDNLQVTENRDIIDFDVYSIFSSYYVGMYQPITSFVFSMIYNLFGGDAKFFHLASLLIHLSNIVLLFILLRLIIDDVRLIIVGILAFAVHPLQVEPICWVSSFSTLLFSFYLFISLIFYVKYQKSSRLLYSAFMIFFFCLSILSKVQAVIAIPIIIIITKIITGNWINRKMIYSIIPVILVSVVFFIVALDGRSSSDKVELSLFHHLIFAVYKISFGFSRIVFPFDLYSLYPVSDTINLTHIFGIVVLVFVIIIVWLARNSENVIIGFALSISVLISILPAFSSYITADRYYYLFVPFAFIMLFAVLIRFKLYPGKIVIMFLSLFWCVLSFYQTQYWINGEKLWSRVIIKEPLLSRGYDGLGLYYLNNEKFEKAYKQFKRSVEVDSTYVDGWYNIGNYYDGAGNLEMAGSYYSIALNYDSCHLASRFNRGSNFIRQDLPDSAIYDLSIVLLSNPEYEKAYTNRGIAYFLKNDFELAKCDFTNSLRLNPKKVISLYYRSLVYLSLGEKKNALDDINVAITIDPDDSRLLDMKKRILKSK
jgi:protein O-mannosyl-transferase